MLSNELQRFLKEINSDDIFFFIFNVCKNGIFMNSGLEVLPKGLRCSILSKITVRMLTFRDRTADVIYYADVTLFLRAFSLRRFLAFYCFKYYLASFSRYKTAFYPILFRLNTPNKTYAA